MHKEKLCDTSINLSDLNNCSSQEKIAKLITEGLLEKFFVLCEFCDDLFLKFGFFVGVWDLIGA